MGTDLSEAIQPYANDNPAAPTGGHPGQQPGPALPLSSFVLPLVAVGAAWGAAWTGRRWFRK